MGEHSDDGAKLNRTGTGVGSTNSGDNETSNVTTADENISVSSNVTNVSNGSVGAQDLPETSMPSLLTVVVLISGLLMGLVCGWLLYRKFICRSRGQQRAPGLQIPSGQELATLDDWIMTKEED